MIWRFLTRARFDGFAIIVARLEDVLGIDPFSTAEDIGFPVTVGEFIQFYENAAS